MKELGSLELLLFSNHVIKTVILIIINIIQNRGANHCYYYYSTQYCYWN